MSARQEKWVEKSNTELFIGRQLLILVFKSPQIATMVNGFRSDYVLAQLFLKVRKKQGFMSNILLSVIPADDRNRIKRAGSSASYSLQFVSKTKKAFIPVIHWLHQLDP